MADSRDDIIVRLLANIDDRYDKTVGSFFYDTQKPLAVEGEALYERIESISSKAFVQTAVGKDLDTKLAEVGMTRIAASYSTGNVKFTGDVGTAITSGTQVKSDSLVFTIEQNGVIGEDGTVTLPAVCNTPGKSGNIPVAAINDLFMPIVGVSEVTNEAAFKGGYDEETDEEVRERYLINAKKPPTSGNKYHYEEWAREASAGVGEVKCIPLWDNQSTTTPGEVKGCVTVLVLDDKLQPADTDLINTVTDYINKERPIGANVIVAAADALNINITVSLLIQSGYSSDDVKKNISTALENYLKNIAFQNTEVSVAHIGSCILSCNGVLDYDDLSVNGNTSNIEVADNQVPVMGVLTVV